MRLYLLGKLLQAVWSRPCSVSTHWHLLLPLKATVGVFRQLTSENSTRAVMQMQHMAACSTFILFVCFCISRLLFFVWLGSNIYVMYTSSQQNVYVFFSEQ